MFGENFPSVATFTKKSKFIMDPKNFFKKKSVNSNQENEAQIENEFNKLNVFDKDSNLIQTNCSYCDKPFTKELWCKKCDPFRMIKEWTSGNPDIDKFIKDTYNQK